MLGGELELALLQVNAPDVARLVRHPILVHAVVSVRPVHVLSLNIIIREIEEPQRKKGVGDRKDPVKFAPNLYSK